MAYLSRWEREYIVSGVNEDFRTDGRSCKDYRHFTLETGVVSNTSGSARIKLDRTCVVVGVKAELGVPTLAKPSEGRIEFSVDCCALATPEFEGREGEELGSHLAHELLKAYSNSGCLDLSSLAVIPGQQCWVLYVDALVLEWGGGGVLESLSVAVVAALKVTRIPRLIISGEGEDMEFEVSDNPHDVVKLDVKGAPVIITLSQIGNHFLVDASMQEELCASARLFVAINSSQNIVSISKDGFGGLLYNKLQDVILMAQEVCTDVFTRIDTNLTDNHNKQRLST
ncbi:hypothetical protein EMCRGX_G031546 [Ephydatia muelleri]